jgi:Flp pilus assembly protein TadG
MKRGFGIVKRVGHLAFGERGAALAELAIMMPFLAVMLAAVCEFGRFFQNYTTLAKATRVSARYLSNHPQTDTEKAKGINLMVCGQLSCSGKSPVVSGFTASNVCVQYVGTPTTTVTVSIPRNAGDCGTATPYTYAPIFNIGALINDNTYSLALPIAPSTTMYFMLN